MAIQSMTPGNTPDPEDVKTDDEIAFLEAREKGWLTDDEKLYFRSQGFPIAD